LRDIHSQSRLLIIKWLLSGEVEPTNFMSNLLKSFVKWVFGWISWKLYQIIFWLRFTVIDSRGGYFLVGVTFGFIGLFLFSQTNDLRAMLISSTTHKSVINLSTPIATASEQDVPVVQDNNALANYLADQIYHKETSNGKFDQKCERITFPGSDVSMDLHNGYGFRQGTDRNYCLGSDEEMRVKVIARLIELIEQGLTDNQILCLYNTGTASDTCHYLSI